MSRVEIKNLEYKTLMTEAIASWREERDPYVVRFARTSEDCERAQRLRFDVFSREFGATVQGSDLGLDIDPLDERADHLLVIDRRTNTCVGTYRLATWEQLGGNSAFYTERIFDMSGVDLEVRRQGIELGRACVSSEHRTRGVFQLLLRGIGAYLVQTQKQYLFGCGSVPIKELAEARVAMAEIELKNWLDTSLTVKPTEQYTSIFPEVSTARTPTQLEIPALLYAYCALGARLAPSPAYDPDFRTLDFFVLLDLDHVDPRAYARYCQPR